MSEPTLSETLKSLRFFEDIAEADLEEIASVARLENFRPGALLFHEAERQTDIFVVAEGTVSLEICLPGQGCKRIQTVGPGELVGWSPILGESPMTATARAIDRLRLVAIDAAQLLALCSHNPVFGYTLMRRTAQVLALRLNATRLQLLDVYRNEIPMYTGPEGAD